MSKSYPVRETWRPRRKRKRPPLQQVADVVVHPHVPGFSGVYLKAGHTYELSYSFTVTADELWPSALPKEGVSGGPYPKHVDFNYLVQDRNQPPVATENETQEGV